MPTARRHVRRLKALGCLPSSEENLMYITDSQRDKCTAPEVWYFKGENRAQEDGSYKNSLLPANAITYPKETKSSVQMLDNLVRKPYATAEGIFTQLGIWILMLSYI